MLRTIKRKVKGLYDRQVFEHRSVEVFKDFGNRLLYGNIMDRGKADLVLSQMQCPRGVDEMYFRGRLEEIRDGHLRWAQKAVRRHRERGARRTGSIGGDGGDIYPANGLMDGLRAGQFLDTTNEADTFGGGGGFNGGGGGSSWGDSGGGYDGGGDSGGGGDGGGGD